MKKRLLRVLDLSLSTFKILLSILMMVEGISTIFSDTVAVDSAVAIIYGSHVALVLFGIYLFISGAVLFYGKIKKHKRVVGNGLMMAYIAFLFATIIQLMAGFDWISNLIVTIIVAILYLRWKYNKFYSQPIR